MSFAPANPPLERPGEGPQNIIPETDEERAAREAQAAAIAAEIAARPALFAALDTIIQQQARIIALLERQPAPPGKPMLSTTGMMSGTHTREVPS